MLPHHPCPVLARLHPSCGLYLASQKLPQILNQLPCLPWIFFQRQPDGIHTALLASHSVSSTSSDQVLPWAPAASELQTSPVIHGCLQL